MTTYNEAIVAAADIWFSDGMTMPVSYQGVPIRGHFAFEEVGPEGSQATLEVLRADVPHPQLDDQVVISGDTYYVASVLGSRDGQVVRRGDDVSWVLYLSREIGGGY